MNRPQIKSARETIGQSFGYGFLVGLVLPIVAYTAFDLPIESPPLFLVMVIFVGTPFVMAGLGWALASVGVKRFGRPMVEGVNVAVLLLAIAMVGGFAGYALSGKNLAISALFGIGLVIPNALLFYSRRKYMFGTDASEENSDRGLTESHDRSTS